MRHLKKDSLEIWVLEEPAESKELILQVEGGLTPKILECFRLPEITEEQARKIKNLPIKISVGSDALPNLRYLIDQLLKENGLNGLRVGDRPEPVSGKEVDLMKAVGSSLYDSKVPPKNIIVKI